MVESRQILVMAPAGRTSSMVQHERMRLVWTVHVKPLLKASGAPAEPGLGAVGTQASHSQFYNKKPKYLLLLLTPKVTFEAEESLVHVLGSVTRMLLN